MWWYETDSNLLKIRNENDSAWINVAYVDQTNSVYAVLDNTKLVNTTGAQTGLLGWTATKPLERWHRNN